MNLEGKTINFLGDSITEGCGVENMNNRFDNVLKNMCSLKKVNNYGVGGTRIAPRKVPSEKARYDLDFALRSKEMDRDCDVVVVFGGVNDYLHGDAPFGTLDSEDKSTFCGSVRNLCVTLSALFPSSVIVFFTPAHALGDGGYSTCDIKPQIREEHVLLDFCNAIREIAMEHGFPVFSLMDELGLDPNNREDREKYTVDGLHFNDLGHIRIAETMKRCIETI